MPKTKYNLLHIVYFSGLSKWSTHEAVFDNVNNNYPLVPLSKVLKRIKEPITIEDDSLYKRITVRLYGKGVLKRDEVYGREIGTKRQFVAHAGQLIISRIDARNGAFGLVPKELEGAIVTNDFWLFDVHDALPEYLMLVLSSDLFQKYWQTQSSGTTNRQRVSENNFLSSTIALPQIEEQKKLVDLYFKKIQEAIKYETRAKDNENDINTTLFDLLGIKKKSNTIYESQMLKILSFSSLYQWGVDKNTVAFPYDFTKYKAFSFATKPIWLNSVFRGKSPKYSNESTSLILNQKCNRTDYIDMSFAKTVDTRWLESINDSLLTRENDVIINSTGEGTIGRASLIPKKYAGLAYDSHMILLRVNKEYVDPQLLVDLINCPFGQKQVELYKSAQATKQTELGIENIKKLLFPLPDISEQKRISSIIEAKKQEMTTLINEAFGLRKEARTEFDKSVFG